VAEQRTLVVAHVLTAAAIEELPDRGLDEPAGSRMSCGKASKPDHNKLSPKDVYPRVT
jgi:hypothetical protein